MAAVDMETVLNGPVLPPPSPDIVSNFDDPDNNNALAVGVLTVCVIIPTLAVFIRVYERVYVQRRFLIEEAMTLAAFVCFVLSVAAMFVLVGLPGYFVHSWDVRMRDMAPFAMWVLIMGNGYSFAMTLVKSAILIEWCRMFVPGNRLHSWFWWGATSLIAIQILFAVIFTILLHVRCTPHAAVYDPIAALTATCYFKIDVCQIGSGVVQLIADIGMFVLPIPVIWGLQMNLTKKLGVSIIFGAGIICVVSSAARLYETVAYVNSDDPLYDFAPAVFWVAAEMAVSFLVICVPCLPKFFRETGIRAGWRRAFNMPPTEPTGTPGSKGPSAYYAGGGKSGNNSSNNGSGLGSMSHDHGGAHGHHLSKLGGVTTDSRAYYQLDEEGHPLDELKTASTERLRDEAAATARTGPRGGLPSSPGVGIVRTTRVAITQTRGGGGGDTGSVSDESHHDLRQHHPHAGWDR